VFKPKLKTHTFSVRHVGPVTSVVCQKHWSLLADTGAIQFRLFVDTGLWP